MASSLRALGKMEKKMGNTIKDKKMLHRYTLLFNSYMPKSQICTKDNTHKVHRAVISLALF